MRIRFPAIVVMTAMIFSMTSKDDVETVDFEFDTLQIPEIESNCDFIDEIAEMYGIDDDIIRAVIEIESHGDANAIGDNGNSFGLMQIQPQWHRERIDRLNVTDLLNPYQNVLVGTDILAELYKTYGSWERALTAYNAGDPDADTDYAERVLQEVENQE